MKQYNIDRLSKEEIFGGKLIAPMKQWLKTHNIETKHYDFHADMAIITHYLQNINHPEGELYQAEALPLMERYYRATHTHLREEDEIEQENSENLFAAIRDTPIYRLYEDNNAFTFVDLFAGIGGFRIALEQLGGRCVYASEFESSARKSYGMNHGVVPFGNNILVNLKHRIRIR